MSAARIVYGIRGVRPTQSTKGIMMSEPREEDDIALGLDEEEGEDETYDTLDEKYGDD